MTDYHILEQNPKGDGARVVYHIDTPTGTNAAGMAWSTALLEYLDDLFVPLYSGDVRPVSEVPNLDVTDPTHYAALQAGTIIEHSEQIRYPADATVPQKITRIETRGATLETQVPNQTQRRLRLWSRTDDLP